ncbi:hypothetical protein FKM82_026650 [Ascaphus truei]
MENPPLCGDSFFLFTRPFQIHAEAHSFISAFSFLLLTLLILHSCPCPLPLSLFLFPSHTPPRAFHVRHLVLCSATEALSTPWQYATSTQTGGSCCLHSCYRDATKFACKHDTAVFPSG